MKKMPIHFLVKKITFWPLSPSWYLQFEALMRGEKKILPVTVLHPSVVVLKFPNFRPCYYVAATLTSLVYFFFCCVIYSEEYMYNDVRYASTFILHLLWLDCSCLHHKFWQKALSAGNSIIQVQSGWGIWNKASTLASWLCKVFVVVDFLKPS